MSVAQVEHVATMVEPGERKVFTSEDHLLQRMEIIHRDI